MRALTLAVVLVAAMVGLSLTGCETTKVSEGSGKAQSPEVVLDRIEVAHSWVSGVEGQKPEFYVDAKEKRGSPLDLAFVFDIHNPNDFKIMLDELRFTMAFEGFELTEPSVYEEQWIPANTTNQLRVHATLDAYTTLLAMLVPAGNVEKWNRMGEKPAVLIKKWWETVGDFAFPIELRNGVATFVNAEGETIMSTFQGTFPQTS
jgi:hypothetical protein